MHQTCTRKKVASWILRNICPRKVVNTQKGYLFAQPKTPQTSCKLWTLTFVIKLRQACENQTWWNLLKQDESSLWIKGLDDQLASCLLITCSRHVNLQSRKAIRTYPYVGLMTTAVTGNVNFLQPARFWLSIQVCYLTKFWQIMAI